MSVDLSVFLSRVGAHLGSRLEEESRRWSSTELPDPAFSAIKDLVSNGGKRVRPSFVALGWAAAMGAADSEMPVVLGAAVELLHVSALLHDDVVDASTTRRGAPTAHIAAAMGHRDKGWNGDAEAYGLGVAVLAGDLAAAIADEMVAVMSAATRAQWQQMKTEVAVGQVLDHVATARATRDEAIALEVVRLKTSQYTVVRPLLMGATQAQETFDSALADGLAAYGRAVGEAFQLRDDVLGVFGDEKTTGKPVGNDLREGKPTLLIANAHARASGEQRRALDRIGAVDLTDDDIARITSILRETGALAGVEERIEERTREAREILSGMSIPTDVRLALSNLADSLMSRAS